jgi:hypothetical protein
MVKIMEKSYLNKTTLFAIVLLLGLGGFFYWINQPGPAREPKATNEELQELCNEDFSDLVFYNESDRIQKRLDKRNI